MTDKQRNKYALSFEMILAYIANVEGFDMKTAEGQEQAVQKLVQELGHHSDRLGLDFVQVVSKGITAYEDDQAEDYLAQTTSNSD